MEKILLIVFLAGVVPMSVVSCPMPTAVVESSNAAAGERIRALADMAVGRAAHTSTLLGDGRVLIVGGFKTGGGSLRQVELFVPGTGVFETTGSLLVARAGHTATALPDGKVLISGGSDERDSQGAYNSLEIFDPASGRSSKAAQLSKTRYKLNGAVVRLPSGKVLIAGGSDSAEIFDPASMEVHTVKGTFGSKRLFATATLLNDGRVLIAGGYDEMTRVGQGAWIFESDVAKVE